MKTYLLFEKPLPEQIAKQSMVFPPIILGWALIPPTLLGSVSLIIALSKQCLTAPGWAAEQYAVLPNGTMQDHTCKKSLRMILAAIPATSSNAVVDC